MYIKLATLEFPRYEGDIRLEHPEIDPASTGENFPCPSTYAKVEYVPPPEITATQSCDIVAPVQDETGAWKTAWVVRDLTAEELAEIAQRPRPKIPGFQG